MNVKTCVESDETKGIADFCRYPDDNYAKTEKFGEI